MRLDIFTQKIVQDFKVPGLHFFIESYWAKNAGNSDADYHADSRL